MELGTKVRYKTVRGMYGTKYQVRMTEEEINFRRILGLIGCVVIGMPAWVLVMALAARLI